MTQNFNTAGDIGFRSTGKVKKRLLRRGNYKLVAAKFGQAFTQGKHTTLTGKWRRYENFPTAEAPLSEGITPPGRKLAKTDVTSTLQQFGDWAELTDVVFDTHEDDVPKETVSLCGDQMGETVEVVTIATLKSGSNVFYANNAGSRAAVNSPPLAGDFKRIERSLNKNKAELITSMIAPSQKISTEPIDPAFMAMGHTDLKADIEAMEGFIPVKNYSETKKVHPTEVGSLGRFRFCLTPLFEAWLAAASSATGTTYLSSGDIPSSALAPDVYPIIVVGKDSYGVVRLQGMNAVSPAVHYPKPVPGDELGQRGFVSWKIYYTSVILNSAWCARYEVAATALPS
uniref:Putative capsid protein n=2 Tax=viral metagenome TaxID=1070528 RepID=A0A6M3J3A7_9ZZZZ